MIPQYDIDGLGGEFLVTEALEKKIAGHVGAKHCVMVTSGTVAIFLALRAVGAKKVAVPPLTMFASATAAELAGCEVFFVSNNDLAALPTDIDTYVHVSLNGRDNGIADVVKRFPHITIVEDAAQSFGSQHEGKYLGTFGKVGCYSFSPHKIISAGNGGCIVTDDEDIARTVRKLKNFGREKGGADFHDSIGYNFKFTDIQARFMEPQFAEIDIRVAKKKHMYARYALGLADMMRPHTGTPWFVDVYIDERDAVAATLKEKGIGTRSMYPLIPWMPPYKEYSINGDSAKDIEYSKRGLWLPSSLSLTDAQIDEVIAAVQSAK